MDYEENMDYEHLIYFVHSNFNELTIIPSYSEMFWDILWYMSKYAVIKLVTNII